MVIYRQALLNAIRNAGSTEEVSAVLEKFGISSSYVTLAGKQEELDEYRETQAREKAYVDRGSDPTVVRGEYSLDQLVMVRATDIFTADNMMTSPKDGQLLRYYPLYMESEVNLRKKVFDKMNISVDTLSEDEATKYDKAFEEKYLPVGRNYRWTKHH